METHKAPKAYRGRIALAIIIVALVMASVIFTLTRDADEQTVQRERSDPWLVLSVGKASGNNSSPPVAPTVATTTTSLATPPTFPKIEGIN